MFSITTRSSYLHHLLLMLLPGMLLGGPDTHRNGPTMKLCEVEGVHPEEK